nr:pentatricopeptide repeat-containing protein At5g50390, chloroplastic [Ipomoea batatas]
MMIGLSSRIAEAKVMLGLDFNRDKRGRESYRRIERREAEVSETLSAFKLHWKSQPSSSTDMDAIRKQLDVLMGANRNGDVREVDRNYFDRDVCRLYLSGLCPHDLFQLTKMDMGPCPKLHSLELRKDSRAAVDMRVLWRSQNNFREKLRLSGHLSVNSDKKHRSLFSRIKCSFVEPGLVRPPRPISKPKPSKVEDVLREEIPRDETPREDLRSSICEEIEKLVSHKRYREALEFFDILYCAGDLDVGVTTYDALINACMELRSIRGAKRVYDHIVRCSAVVRRNAPKKNYVSWNKMVAGLVESGDYVEAFQLFIRKSEYSDAGPRLISPMIVAAAGLELISAGKQLHCFAVKLGLADDIFISCSLINMYSKCGSIEDAQFVFDEMPEKTSVGWNTIIAGYAFNGYSEEALCLYYEMQEAGVQMSSATFTIVLRVCTRLASVEHAKQAHAGLVRHGFGSDIIANTALIDFYSKWGRIEDARNVFNKMPKKNVISWNALIAGYGNQGRGVEAIELFDKMAYEGMVPNHVTFLAVLSACSYSGLTDLGWEIFDSMRRDYKVKPRQMHYACMIELLGREGLLDEACSLLRDVPFRPSLNMWAALLTACRVHENSVLGKLAAERLYELGPKKLSNYIVLLNIYNSLGKLEEAAAVVHTLKRKDKHHAQTKEIYENLDNLMLEISKHGYVANERTLLPDVDESEQKLLPYHSERLAISFGLINTPSGSPLQLVQSHRICNDCHNAIKLIAMVTDREFVIKDDSRFHRFKNGSVTRNCFENLVRALENGLSDVDPRDCSQSAVNAPPRTPHPDSDIQHLLTSGLLGNKDITVS